MTLGEAVRNRRRNLGMIQTDIEGVSQRSISELERDRVNPRLGTVLLIVRQLGGQVEICWDDQATDRLF